MGCWWWTVSRIHGGLVTTPDPIYRIGARFQAPKNRNAVYVLSRFEAQVAIFDIHYPNDVVDMIDGWRCHIQSIDTHVMEGTLVHLNKCDPIVFRMDEELFTL